MLVYLDQSSASTNIKNLKSYSKKSAERPDGKARSVLHTGQYLGFETVFVKPEIEEHSLICEGNPLDVKSMATKILSHKSDGKISTCMIEYDQDAKLEIKEEIIQVQETVAGQKSDEKYQPKMYTAYVREADIFAGKKKLPAHTKQKVQGSKLEKNYRCEKCGRSYKNKSDLNRHKRFECGVIPQFACHFCAKQFKLNSNLRQHIVRMHQKTKQKASHTKYNYN
ncbi:zinc finger protein with KRAB and SCAN domains 5-like [Belonocnema kinseyi]|uniref:zinc finger protein with KRAB and SCAN domains 5-like n=1 Tax=Belonocnema kinseyi TaxID=2817044 RepID=UPI00143D6614|nr:zinc finger protein with KRAB and SCAN domains 5-like [Belonocnema kinseyi]